MIRALGRISDNRSARGRIIVCGPLHSPIINHSRTIFRIKMIQEGHVRVVYAADDGAKANHVRHA